MAGSEGTDSGPSNAAKGTGSDASWLPRAWRSLAWATLLLMGFGATVRVHGAGLACPDWPLCFGELVPRLDFRIFLEWGHRLVAGCISLGFLGLGGLVLAMPALRTRAGGLVLAAAGVLAVQIALGGLTVLHLLAQWTVTSHLLAANAFLFLLLQIAHRLGAPARAAPTRPVVLGSAVLLVAAVILQAVLGGLVSSSYAGLACTEWPTCFGGVWFPTFSGLIGLQVLHRLGAYTVAGLALLNLAAAWSDPALRRSALILVGLVLVQVALGVGNVLLALPVELAVAHSLVADATLQLAGWQAAAVWQRRDFVSSPTSNAAFDGALPSRTPPMGPA